MGRRKKHWLWAFYLSTLDKKGRKDALALFGGYKTLKGLFGSSRKSPKSTKSSSDTSDGADGCFGCGCFLTIIVLAVLFFGNYKGCGENLSQNSPKLPVSQLNKGGQEEQNSIRLSAPNEASRNETQPLKTRETDKQPTMSIVRKELNEALIQAAIDGNIEKTKNLLHDGADINSRNRNGRTPLMIAAMRGHDNMVRYLIEHNAAINAQSESGWTALIEAILRGETIIVSMLIANGADVNLRDDFNNTPLHHAVVRGRVNIVRTLKQSGADLNARDFAGKTPYNLAVDSGNQELIYVLSH